VHNEPSVGRLGEALGGDPGATGRCGMCGCGSARMWRGARRRVALEATITRLGAIVT